MSSVTSSAVKRLNFIMMLLMWNTQSSVVKSTVAGMPANYAPCSISLITLAGFPTTTAFAGTLRETTAPAPTTAFRLYSPLARGWRRPDPHIVLDHDRFGHFQAPDAGLRLKVMSGGIDMDSRPDHDMAANTHLITIQNDTQDIQKDSLADINVLAIATVEGRLNDRILADSS